MCGEEELGERAHREAAPGPRGQSSSFKEQPQSQCLQEGDGGGR